MIHSQLGAQMIMKGTGRPNSQPRTSTRLRPQASASWPETRLANALTTPKLTMKETISVVEAMPNSSDADQRHDGSLDPDHAADEGVDQDEQRELRPVLAEAEPDDARAGSLNAAAGRSFRQPPADPALIAAHLAAASAEPAECPRA